MIKNIIKSKIKKKVIHVALLLIKPFIIPIIIIGILVFLVSSITDILYIAFENDDKIDMQEELAYYGTQYEKEKDEKEIKGFFTSVFDFIGKICGGEMCEDTDWPVERTLYNKQWIWKKRCTYYRSINISFRY